MRRLGPRVWFLIFIALALTAGLLLFINSRYRAPGPVVMLATETVVPTLAPETPAKATNTVESAPSAPATAEATRTPAGRPTAPTPPASPPASPTQAASPTSSATPLPTVTQAPPTPPAKPQPARPPTKPAPSPSPTATRVGHSYYVDSVHGSDENSGLAPDVPWQTLAPVNNKKFGPGDTINLARGSSWTGPGNDSAALLIRGSGKSDNPIAVQPYGKGDAPLLRNPSQANSMGVSVRGQWVIVQGLNLRDARLAGVSLEQGADHTVVQDNEMSAVGSGVLVWSEYNYIVRNYVHDTTLVENSAAPDSNYGADGVLLHASNNEVAYNRFVNCKAASQNYGTDGGAVEFFGEVNDTYVHHNYSFNSDGFTEVGGGSARSVLLTYNVVVNSGPVIGLHAAGRFASDIEDFQFVNNTVVDLAGAYSLYYIEGNLKNPEALVVRNNIFYVKDYRMLLQNPQPFTHDHNLYYFDGSPPQVNYAFGDTEKAQDPQFVDLAQGDYRLRAGSPAIKAGMAMNNAAHDYANISLPAGADRDLGAYQYRGGQS